MITLPDRMPVSISRLPVNKVGYPVPWFVWFNPDVNDWDFRILRPGAIQEAMKGACWICGEPREGLEAFVIGPMCAVNHTSAEPPSHLSCARWAAKACPFLAKPQMVRRDRIDFPHADVPGTMIARNPGVTLLWKVRPGDYYAYRVDNGLLFDIGEPRGVEWIAHGRDATRQEILTSIESGLPILRDIAEQEGVEAVAELERRTNSAMELLPA